MRNLARLVGFEPTTYGLEVRCSIQLSYRRPIPFCSISPNAVAVKEISLNFKNVVGARGFEPPTPCAQGRCATSLRHAPFPKGDYTLPLSNCQVLG